jgi:hypothetical protein
MLRRDCVAICGEIVVAWQMLAQLGCRQGKWGDHKGGALGGRRQLPP